MLATPALPSSQPLNGIAISASISTTTTTTTNELQKSTLKTDINFNSPGHQSSQDGSFIQDDDAMQLILDFGTNPKPVDLRSPTAILAAATAATTAHSFNGTAGKFSPANTGVTNSPQGTLVKGSCPPPISSSSLSNSWLNRKMKQQQQQWATDFDANVAELDFEDFSTEDIVTFGNTRYDHYDVTEQGTPRSNQSLNGNDVYVDVRFTADTGDCTGQHGRMVLSNQADLTSFINMQQSLDDDLYRSGSLFSSVEDEDAPINFTQSSGMSVSRNPMLESGICLAKLSAEEKLEIALHSKTGPFISTDSLDFSSFDVDEEQLKEACAPKLQDYRLTFQTSQYLKNTESMMLADQQQASTLSDIKLTISPYEQSKPFIPGIIEESQHLMEDEPESKLYGGMHSGQRVKDDMQKSDDSGASFTTWGKVKRSYEMGHPQTEVYKSKCTSLPNVSEREDAVTNDASSYYTLPDGAGEKLLSGGGADMLQSGTQNAKCLPIFDIRDNMAISTNSSIGSSSPSLQEREFNRERFSLFHAFQAKLPVAACYGLDKLQEYTSPMLHQLTSPVAESPKKSQAAFPVGYDDNSQKRSKPPNLDLNLDAEPESQRSRRISDRHDYSDSSGYCTGETITTAGGHDIGSREPLMEEDQALSETDNDTPRMGMVRDETGYYSEDATTATSPASVSYPISAAFGRSEAAGTPGGLVQVEDYEYGEVYVDGRYIDVNHNEIGYNPPSTEGIQQQQYMEPVNHLFMHNRHTVSDITPLRYTSRKDTEFRSSCEAPPAKPPRTFAEECELDNARMERYERLRPKRTKSAMASSVNGALRDSATQVPVYVVNQSVQTSPLQDSGCLVTVVTTSVCDPVYNKPVYVSRKISVSPPSSPREKCRTSPAIKMPGFGPLGGFTLPDLGFMKLPFNIPSMMPHMSDFPLAFMNSGDHIKSLPAQPHTHGFEFQKFGLPSANNFLGGAHHTVSAGGPPSPKSNLPFGLLSEVHEPPLNRGSFGVPFTPPMNGAQFLPEPPTSREAARLVGIQNFSPLLHSTPKAGLSPPNRPSPSPYSISSNSESTRNHGRTGIYARDSGLGTSSSGATAKDQSVLGPGHIQDWDSLQFLLPSDVVQAYSFFRANANLLTSEGFCGKTPYRPFPSAENRRSLGKRQPGQDDIMTLSIDKPLVSPRQKQQHSSGGGTARMRGKALRKRKPRPLSEPVALEAYARDPRFESIAEEDDEGVAQCCRTGPVCSSIMTSCCNRQCQQQQQQHEHGHRYLRSQQSFSSAPARMPPGTHHHHHEHHHVHHCCCVEPMCHKQCCQTSVTASFDDNHQQQHQTGMYTWPKRDQVHRNGQQHQRRRLHDEDTYSSGSETDTLQQQTNPTNMAYQRQRGGVESDQRHLIRRTSGGGGPRRHTDLGLAECRLGDSTNSDFSSSSDDGALDANRRHRPVMSEFALHRYNNDADSDTECHIGPPPRFWSVQELTAASSSEFVSGARSDGHRHQRSLSEVRPCATCFRVRSPSVTSPVDNGKMFCDCETSDIIEEREQSLLKCDMNNFNVERVEKGKNGKACDPIPVKSPEYRTRRDFVRNVAKASDGIVALFGGSTNSDLTPKQIEELKNGIGNSLCPAIWRILTDGILPKKSVWCVIQASAILGPATKSIHDLVTDLQTADNEPREAFENDLLRFQTFLIGLLNLQAVDCWLSYLALKDKVLKEHYSATSFMFGAATVYKTLFTELMVAIQPLSLLPFEKLQLQAPARIARISFQPVLKFTFHTPEPSPSGTPQTRSVNASPYRAATAGAPPHFRFIPTSPPSDSRIPKSSSLPSRLSSLLRTRSDGVRSTSVDSGLTWAQLKAKMELRHRQTLSPIKQSKSENSGTLVHPNDLMSESEDDNQLDLVAEGCSSLGGSLRRSDR